MSRSQLPASVLNCTADILAALQMILFFCLASCTSCVLLALLKVNSCTRNTVAGPTQVCCIMSAMFYIRLAVVQWLQTPSGSHCANRDHSFWSLIQLILLKNQPGGLVSCEN